MELLTEVGNALQSIKEAERYVDVVESDSYMELTEKYYTVLVSIQKGDDPNLKNEFSSAVLKAWDYSHQERFSQLKQRADYLQFLLVDVTEIRNTLTEESANYDMAGIDGTLCKNSRYIEALEILKTGTKRLDGVLRRSNANIWSNVLSGVWKIVVASVLLWAATIANYSSINSVKLLIGIMIGETLVVYLLFLGLVFGIFILSQIIKRLF